MKLHLFKPGQMIAGKFRVESILAEGSTAIVLVASHIGLGTTAVLKILHPQFARHPDSVQRFMREARAVARLKSDHVVRIQDVDTLADGTPYMVMEHLVGMALDTLARKGPLSTTKVVEALLQACSGVAEAHAAGVVHRDLKPANLFCTTAPDGSLCVKVLDFGVSKLTPKFDSDAAATIAIGPEIFGSPAYMAPEQIESAISVDERADVWALGAILYELLAGRRAFPGKTITEVFTSIADEAPEPLRERSPEVPVELEAIVTRCLQKRRVDRFQSVRSLAEALVEFAGEVEPVPTSRRLVIVTKPAAMPAPLRLPVDRTAPGRSALPMAGWIVAAVAVLGMGVLTYARRTTVSVTDEPAPVVRVTSAVMPVMPAAPTPAVPEATPAPAPPPTPPVIVAKEVGDVMPAPAPAPAPVPAPRAPRVERAHAPSAPPKAPSANAAPAPTNVASLNTAPQAIPNVTSPSHSTPPAKPASAKSAPVEVPADYAPFGGRK